MKVREVLEDLGAGAVMGIVDGVVVNIAGALSAPALVAVVTGTAVSALAFPRKDMWRRTLASAAFFLGTVLCAEHFHLAAEKKADTTPMSPIVTDVVQANPAVAPKNY
jgi:NAD(P)-dependent dehydrogenase (short-subunit alcohol dehydrogenase family)